MFHYWFVTVSPYRIDKKKDPTQVGSFLIYERKEIKIT